MKIFRLSSTLVHKFLFCCSSKVYRQPSKTLRKPFQCLDIPFLLKVPFTTNLEFIWFMKYFIIFRISFIFPLHVATLKYYQPRKYLHHSFIAVRLQNTVLLFSQLPTSSLWYSTEIGVSDFLSLWHCIFSPLPPFHFKNNDWNLIIMAFMLVHILE